MSENQTTTSWGSRLGFILASAGSAVGLGAIWKFPYMAGTNGGSVFMLPYIFFTFTVGISLLVAEFAMGRAGREGPMASLTKVCGRGWGFFGGVGVFTVFLILSFYSGVGGWCIKYMVDAVIGRGLISDPELLGTHFGAFVSDGSMSFLYMMIFLGITSVVVLRGIQGGIERVAKVLMPALFILMLIIIVRGLTLPGGLAGLEYLFAPRWEDFNASALFNAMGFCFFSLSLGAGTMITYGSYLSPKADLPGAVGWVAVLAIMSSILGGLMVLPAVFAFGLDPSAGPGLTFVTMPAVFSKMPLGQLFAVMFYVCPRRCGPHLVRLDARSLYGAPHPPVQHAPHAGHPAHRRELHGRGPCRPHSPSASGATSSSSTGRSSTSSTTPSRPTSACRSQPSASPSLPPGWHGPR